MKNKTYLAILIQDLRIAGRALTSSTCSIMSCAWLYTMPFGAAALACWEALWLIREGKAFSTANQVSKIAIRWGEIKMHTHRYWHLQGYCAQLEWFGAPRVSSSLHHGPHNWLYWHTSQVLPIHHKWQPCDGCHPDILAKPRWEWINKKTIPSWENHQSFFWHQIYCPNLPIPYPKRHWE